MVQGVLNTSSYGELILNEKFKVRQFVRWFQLIPCLKWIWRWRYGDMEMEILHEKVIITRHFHRVYFDSSIGGTPGMAC